MPRCVAVPAPFVPVSAPFVPVSLPGIAHRRPAVPTPQWWYVLPCWSYSCAGLVTLWHSSGVLLRGSEQIPWRLKGAVLCFQGLASFMNDVATWGQMESPWKLTDVALASTLTLLQVLIVLVAVAGPWHRGVCEACCSAQCDSVDATPPTAFH